MSRRCFKSEIQGRPGPQGHTNFWHHVAFRGIALQPHCGVIFPHPSRVPQRNTPLQRHDRRDKRVTVHPPNKKKQTNGTLRFGATTPTPFLVWVVMGDRLLVFKKMRLRVPRGGKAIGAVLAVLAPCSCVPPRDPEA